MYLLRERQTHTHIINKGNIIDTVNRDTQMSSIIIIKKRQWKVLKNYLGM